MSEQKKSWRDFYQVHPAASLFPLLPQDELRKLGESIKADDLKEKIALYSAYHSTPVVLDGQNRLDAMELVGIPTLEEGHDGRWILRHEIVKHFEAPPPKDSGWTAYSTQIPDPYSYVISRNLRRRHLTKEQQAELILKALEMREAERGVNPEVSEHLSKIMRQSQQLPDLDLAKMARSKTRRFPGRNQGGSTKDEFKAKAVEAAKEQKIGKRTMERVIAKHKGPTFQRAPEPLEDFDVRAVTQKILSLLEPASELEIREVLAAIQRRFLSASSNEDRVRQ